MTEWSDAYVSKMAYNKQRQRALREIAFRHNAEFQTVLDEFLAADTDYDPKISTARPFRGPVDTSKVTDAMYVNSQSR